MSKKQPILVSNEHFSCSATHAIFLKTDIASFLDTIYAVLQAEKVKFINSPSLESFFDFSKLKNCT